MVRARYDHGVHPAPEAWSPASTRPVALLAVFERASEKKCESHVFSSSHLFFGTLPVPDCSVCLISHLEVRGRLLM